MSIGGDTSASELLASGPFAQIPAEHRDRIARLGVIQRVPAQQVVFHKGDPADRLYLVLEGRVRVLSSAADEPVELRTVGPGEAFGELGLLDGGRRSATIETVQETLLFTLDRDAFLQVLGESPELVSLMLNNLSEYIRSVTERLVRDELEQRTIRAEMEVERFRSLTQMVAGVAHELNTPLGIVRTASSIIRQRLDSGNTEDVVEAARLLEANVERAFRLVQSFKHVAAGSLTDPLEELNLREVVQDTVDLFSLSARKARITVVVRCDANDDLTWVGYRGYFGQVLLNLLTNVERYAYPDGGGGSVEISLAAMSDQLQVTVRDTGRGIPAESLARVWEPFFTTGRARGGTGLGLSIVRNIVSSRLAGEVSLESTLGLGTTVRVRMPRVAKGNSEGRT